VTSENTRIHHDVLDKNIVSNLQKKAKLFKRLLKVYLTMCREYPARLTQAVDKKDMSQVEELAHPFKSSSAQMGAMALSAYLQQLEEMGRNNQLDKNIIELIEKINIETDLVVKELDGLALKAKIVNS